MAWAMFALEAPARVLDIGGGGTVEIALPAPWKLIESTATVYTFEDSRRAPGALLQLSFLPPSLCGNDSHADLRSLKRIVELKASDASAKSGEKELLIRAIKTSKSDGSYFVARAVDSGSYRFVQKGAVSVRGRAVLFTIYSMTSNDYVHEMMPVLERATFQPKH